MKISPIDIRKQTFEIMRKGYDKEEVRLFLAAVAEDYENTLRELSQMKGELAGLQESMTGITDREEILKRTLMTAQQVSDQIKTQAVQERELRLKEAEMDAEKLMEEARRRVESVEMELANLKLQRARLTSEVKGSAEALIRYVNELVDPK